MNFLTGAFLIGLLILGIWQVWLGREEETPLREGSLQGGLVPGLLLVLFILAVLTYVWQSNVLPSPADPERISFAGKNRSDPQEGTSPDGVPRLSAVNLNRAWQDNEISAKQKYDRKWLEVFGTVDRVKEGTGPRNASIGLEGTTLFGVVCDLVESQWEQAMQLRRGQSLTVRGTCYGNLGGFTGVMLMNCEIVK